MLSSLGHSFPTRSSDVRTASETSGAGFTQLLGYLSGRWNRLTPFSLLHSLGGTGGWSAKGCELLSRNRTHVTCQCSRSASCAVLMDISRREVGVSPLPTPSASLGANPYGNLHGLVPNPSPPRPSYHCGLSKPNVPTESCVLPTV